MDNSKAVVFNLLSVAKKFQMEVRSLEILNGDADAFEL